jgi:DNA-directed RNA polymerase specialized sigma24 family protein
MRHQVMVRAQLRKILNGDNAKTDYLAQETFRLAWRKPHQFRGDARFSTWLYRIAYSGLLQACQKRLSTVEDIDGDALDQRTSGGLASGISVGHRLKPS